MISQGVSFSLQEDLTQIQEHFWGFPMEIPSLVLKGEDLRRATEHASPDTTSCRLQSVAA